MSTRNQRVEILKFLITKTLEFPGRTDLEPCSDDSNHSTVDQYIEKSLGKEVYSITGVDYERLYFHGMQH